MSFKRLGPGIYADDEGDMHIDARELCTHVGLEPTTRNQDLMEKMVRDAVTRALPDTLVEVEVHENTLPPWVGRG